MSAAISGARAEVAFLVNMPGNDGTKACRSYKTG